MISRIRRAALAALLALGMTAGVLAVTAAPASAAWNDCLNGYVCLYDEYNGGLPYYAMAPTGSGICVNVGGGFNDKANSVKNRRPDKHVSFFQHINCGGEMAAVEVAPGVAKNLTGAYFFGGYKRNSVSSIFVHTG